MKVSVQDQQGDVGLYAAAEKFTDELKWIFRPQPQRDLGIDAIVEVVEDGISNGELLAIQIKSGDSWFSRETIEYIPFTFNEDHYEYWIQYPVPVLILLHRPDGNVCYWQIVNENTAISTGKGWKIQIPKTNILSIENKVRIHGFCDFAMPENSFSIASFKDLSHGAAKRYQARILINRRLSRGEVVQIIAKVTNELRGREYYRNKLTKEVWSGKNANVVWLFVFPSLEDEKNNNWLCRSEWIDPSLPEGSCPIRMSGMAVGEDLVLDWSGNYQDMAKWHSSVTLSKEEYLARVDVILCPIMKDADRAISLAEEYYRSEIDFNIYLGGMKSLQAKINELYTKGTEIGGAPLECEEFNEKFHSVIALADNIVLPFSERGLETWPEKNRDFLVKDAIKNYSVAVNEMRYEQKKLH